MKVWVQYNKRDTGKGKFLQRVAWALVSLGVKMSTKKHKADIVMFMNHVKEPTKIPSINRVDGVHLEKAKKYDVRRKLVKHACNSASAVIFQSEFCRQMLKPILRLKPKREFVIFNGADPQDYDVEPYKSPYQYNVVISGRYAAKSVRPHKRVWEMANIARAYTEMREDVCFWFCGETRGEFHSNGRVKFLGDVSESNLRRLLARADVMLSLSWFSWCPNAVVEALAAGVPVIGCEGSGGIEELIRGCGILVPQGGHPKPRLFNANRPPEVHPEVVFHALDRLLECRPAFDTSHIHIKNIAQQYKAAFEEVLNAS